jgi:HEAT repeat protein
MQIAESDVAIQVRVAAIDALAQLKADRAVPLLIRTTAAVDLDLKHAALSALGPFAHSDVSSVLVAAAEADELSTRLAGIRALGSSREAQSVEKLRQIAIGDVELAALTAAIDALEQSPVSLACEVLLSLTLYPKCRDMCVAALSRLDASRLDELAHGLKHDMVDVRRATVEALSRHPDRRALQHLKSARHDPNPSVRQAATKSLALSLAPHSRETES